MTPAQRLYDKLLGNGPVTNAKCREAVTEARQEAELQNRLETIDRACCEIRFLVRRRDRTAEERLRLITEIMEKMK